VSRATFAHTAVLAMDADADERAPGAAITVALCGHWDHPPPCPLASHHTSATRDGDELHLRILFAAAAADEIEVRERIGTALGAGVLTGGPDGAETCWRLLDSRAGTVRREEAGHAARLAAS
jgi:hypothetical protein